MLSSRYSNCHSADIDGCDVDSVEDKSPSNWTTHMVRGTWLSNNHSVFYYGLPSPLLDHLRRSRSPVLQTKTFVLFFLLPILTFSWFQFLYFICHPPSVLNCKFCMQRIGSLTLMQIKKTVHCPLLSTRTHCVPYLRNPYSSDIVIIFFD